MLVQIYNCSPSGLQRSRGREVRETLLTTELVNVGVIWYKCVDRTFLERMPAPQLDCARDVNIWNLSGSLANGINLKFRSTQIYCTPSGFYHEDVVFRQLRTHVLLIVSHIAQCNQASISQK